MIMIVIIEKLINGNVLSQVCMRAFESEWPIG